MIEEIIPGNKTRLKIIKAIYENPNINLTSLIRKVKASPNLVLNYVNKLSLFNLINEEKIGGRKKIHIRNLRPNFDSEIGKILYSLVEIEKKFLFSERYRGLRPYFLQLGEIFNKKIDFALVYGSYARFAATEESDLDILIIGKLDNEARKRLSETFVTLEIEPSIKIETVKNFLKNKDKPLFQNIIKEHVVVYGEINFIKFLEKLKK